MITLFWLDSLFWCALYCAEYGPLFEWTSQVFYREVLCVDWKQSALSFAIINRIPLLLSVESPLFAWKVFFWIAVLPSRLTTAVWCRCSVSHALWEMRVLPSPSLFLNNTSLDPSRKDAVGGGGLYSRAFIRVAEEMVPQAQLRWRSGPHPLQVPTRQPATAGREWIA